MKTFVYIFCVSRFIVKIENSVPENKIVEGYYAGLMPDCPGSTKPAIISKRHLNFLEVHVTGLKGPRGIRNKYTYGTANDMANDPTMDWDKPILLYVPGYLDNHHSPIGRYFPGLYKRNGYNVWLLDFFKLMVYEYPVAVRASRAIGGRIAEIIVKVEAAQPRFDIKKLSLLGLSLGGQTMSFIAKTYRNITGTKIARITALDPAGPCFRNRGPDGRVDKSDAEFVDIIYTNIGNSAMSVPAGHVNYYVNGGEFQAGDFYWIACNAVCSHGRSFALWISALLFPDSFIAMKCDSVQDARDNNCYDRKPMVTNLLGLNVDKNKTGIFYLSTTNRFPFFMGTNGLNKENNFLVTVTSRKNAKDILVL